MAVAIPLAMAAVQMSQQKAQADIAIGESQIVAQQEELGAKQREADRKERLSIALASQNAAAGAGGIAAFEGSPLTIMQEDIRREQVATERDLFSTQLAAMTTRSRGKVKQSGLRSQSLLAAGSAATQVVGAT